MEIYRSKYVVREFQVETEMLYSVWLATTDRMNEEEFKEEMLSLAASLKKFDAVLLLTNTKDLLFPIGPDLQQWGVDTISPLLNDTKLKKQAIISPEYIIAQMGMDQTVDDVEKKGQNFKMKFFATTEEAEGWLLK